ncbi:hypothetical protein ACH427_20090 [Streptomyces sp. NPDC020379]|uniref:hypothetical protein n=1 Tax=Streptomyces sp. NPDC020379 TaxID=3365071 RepID=UPI0037AA6024
MCDEGGPSAYAEEALRAVLRAAHEGGGALPPGSQATRNAVCGAVADIWTAGRVLAARGPDAPTARHLLPRVLLSGTEGLAVVLGTRLHGQDASALRYGECVRALTRAARRADPRLAARVASALPGVADGDDRLARPLTGVRASALPAVLGPVVAVLEAERLELAQGCGGLVEGGGSASLLGGERVSVLVERYVLLSAAADCLDGWRHRKAGAGTLTGDRARLVGALSRIAGRLGLGGGPASGWREVVFAGAVAERVFLAVS